LADWWSAKISKKLDDGDARVRMKCAGLLKSRLGAIARKWQENGDAFSTCSVPEMHRPDAARNRPARHCDMLMLS